MSNSAVEAPLAHLESVFAAMPPVRAMALRPVTYDGRRLCLSAPLAANVNDKGCAFGGSLAGALTLAAWGLIALGLARLGVLAEVYVADSRIRYRAPLYADLGVEAELPGSDAEPAPAWREFLDGLSRNGKASLTLSARAFAPDGATAAEFEGRFVAVARAGSQAGGGGLGDR